MKIYIVSKYPIPELENQDADLLVDDIIDLFQDHNTCAVNDSTIALNKVRDGEVKYTYCLSIERIFG